MKKILGILLLLCVVCSILVQPALAAYGYESDEDLKNECGVTFDSNGGSGTMEPLWHNGSFKLPECEFTAPEGYRFKGWQWNGEMKQPGDAVYLDGVRKAVAVWEQLPENPTEGSTAATQPQETTAPAEPPNTEPATEPEATEKVEAKDPAENNDKVWIYLSIALGVVVVGMAIAIVLLLKKK